jgi:glycosyltransferase involved in cell wall biosynthesis
MIVSIAILGHNEAHDIANLIADLATQDLLQDDNLSLAFHVVANGCTDETVSVATSAFGALPFLRSNVTVTIHDLPRPGKSGAWNEFVHRLASQSTDFVFLLDADIRIPERTTLSRVLASLRASHTACVAVDESVKDLSLAPRKTLIERIILAASGTAYDTRTAIAGALYCARFEVLKRIWMPVGLPGEDGFLRAMILTANFSDDERLERLVFVEGARHIFESERTIRGVFRHNVRLTIGTAINILLFHHLRACLKTDKDIGSYIRRRNESDPNWVNDLIREEIRQGRYFLTNSNFIWKRWFRLRSFPISQQIRKAPIFVLGFVFDVALLIYGNVLMRKGVGAGYW